MRAIVGRDRQEQQVRLVCTITAVLLVCLAGGAIALVAAHYTGRLAAPSEFAWLIFLSPVLLAYIVLDISSIVSVGIYNRITWKRRAEIDEDALATVRAGGAFFLYLRSFSFEDVMKIRDDNEETKKYACFHLRHWTSLQFYVATALRHIAPTLGIGGRPSAGITKITTDDEHWQENFEALARASAGIFVVPSLTEGSQWELEWLLQNALEKTVFMTPPDNGLGGQRKTFWYHYTRLMLIFVGFRYRAMKAFRSPRGGLYQLAPDDLERGRYRGLDQATADASLPFKFRETEWALSPSGLSEAATELLARRLGTEAPDREVLASLEVSDPEEYDGNPTRDALLKYALRVLGVLLVLAVLAYLSTRIAH